MMSSQDQDPLGCTSSWEVKIKVETPDFEDLSSYMDDNGQDPDQGIMINNDNYQGDMNNDNYQNVNNYQESIVTIERIMPDDEQADSDYKPNSKTKPKKPKKKYKNKKPQKPWRSNKLYPCTVCDYVANRYNNLTAHMGKHSDVKSLFCDFCPYSTRYKTSLRRHVKYQHVLNDAVEDCPWCEFKTSFKCNLKTHIQRLHSCTECQFKGTADEIRVHFNETHATEKEALSRFILKTAKRVAKNLSNIEADNSQVKTDNYPVNSDNYQVNPDNYQVKTETNSVHSEIDNKSDNDNDIRSDNDNGSDIDDNIFAPECEIMEISNLSQSEDHGMRPEGDAANEWINKTTVTAIKKKTPQEDNKFSCPDCEFTTRKCDNFVKHMQTEHDATFEIDSSYKCRHCDYSSRFKHNVRLHETKHTGEKIYKCTLCDYGTSYNTVFQRHQRKHAQKLLGPFLCDKCSFKTTTHGRLKYHMQRTHQIVNDTAHKCDFCDFYTDVKWRLNKHVNKSQSDGEILCPFCEFKSPFKCQMRMHKKEHLWSLGGDKVKFLRKSARLSGFVPDSQVFDNSGQMDNISVELANNSVELASGSGELVNNNGQTANSSRQLLEDSEQLANNSGQMAYNRGEQANISGHLPDNNVHLTNSCTQLTNIGLNNSNIGGQSIDNMGQLADHRQVAIENSEHPSLTFEQTVEGSHLTDNYGLPIDDSRQLTDNSRQMTQSDQNNFSDDSNSESNYSEHNYTDPSEYQSTSMSNDIVRQYDMTMSQNNMTMSQNNMTLSQDNMTSDNLFSYSVEEQNDTLKSSYTIDEGAVKLNQVRVGYDSSQDKPYSCFQCVFKAKYKAAVQRHYLRHHSSQLKPYKCKYCGFQTTTRDAMWKHTKRSQTLEVINCECNQFSTRFRCELIQHKKTHNNYQCDLCSMSYRSRYDLERHILNHPTDLFKCTMCSYSTEKEHCLLEHESFHAGAKPFKCDVCSYSTVKELLLSLHRRKWHGHLCRVKKIDSVKEGSSDAGPD